MRSVQHRFQEFWMGFTLTCVFREGKLEYYFCDLNFRCSIICINKFTVCEFYERSCHCTSRALCPTHNLQWVSGITVIRLDLSNTSEWAAKLFISTFGTHFFFQWLLQPIHGPGLLFSKGKAIPVTGHGCP
jgi:hypothetical protein